VAGFKGNPFQAGSMSIPDGSWTDGRHIGTLFLPRFQHFDQHAAVTRLTAFTCAREHAIRALHGLYGQYKAILHHAALPDVHAPQSLHNLYTALDISLRLFIRNDTPQHPRLCYRLRKKFMRTTNGKPFFPQQTHKGRQQTVVPREQGAPQPCKNTRAFCIRVQTTERRTTDWAYQHQIRAPMGAQKREHPSGCTQPNSFMRPRRNDLWLSKAFKA
jgi:hypothetical protein